eukprot:9485513-Pyramimonas_sp.AAC.1
MPLALFTCSRVLRLTRLTTLDRYLPPLRPSLGIVFPRSPPPHPLLTQHEVLTPETRALTVIGPEE